MVASAKVDCGRGIGLGLGHASGFGAALEKSAREAKTENEGGIEMKQFFLLLVAFLFCGLIAAQDEQNPYEIALERIRKAEASGATFLDLSRLGLTELPPEIGRLQSLTTLQLY